MSVEALLGTDRAFAADLIAMRPHAGQAGSAREPAPAAGRLADHGQPPRPTSRTHIVQDAYSLRCAPAGGRRPRDTRPTPAAVAERELASAIDNPVVPRTGGWSPTATSTARRSATCWTSWRSRWPTSPRSASGAPTGCWTRPQPGAAGVPGRRGRGGLGLHDRPVHGAAGSSPSSSGWRCRPPSTRSRSSAMQEDHVSMGWAARASCRRGRRAAPGAGDRTGHRRAGAGPAAQPTGARAAAGTGAAGPRCAGGRWAGARPEGVRGAPGGRRRCSPTAPSWTR